MSYKANRLISISSVRDNYSNLDENGKGFVNKLFLWVIILFLSLAIVQFISIYSPPWLQLAMQTCSAIFSGLSIGILFSIFDRVGLLTPVESKLSEILENQIETEKLLTDTANNLQGFTNYQIARLDFGFNSIFGAIEQSSKPKKFHMSQGETDSEIIKLIDSTGANTKFCFLNSYIEASRYRDSIYRAVERGAIIRFLLAKPKISSSPLCDRFNDYVVRDGVYIELSDFIFHVEDRMKPLVRLSNQVNLLRSEHKIRGKFEIKFYENSLNFPLMSLNERVGTSDIPQVIWTGFYGHTSSESIPYIEWRGGALEIISIFSNMFENKWKDADHVNTIASYSIIEETIPNCTKRPTRSNFVPLITNCLEPKSRDNI